MRVAFLTVSPYSQKYTMYPLGLHTRYGLHGRGEARPLGRIPYTNMRGMERYNTTKGSGGEG